jgi:O-antigen/teichoic acid export membrane protein
MHAISHKIKDIWQHAGFQKYFRNTSWMFIGQLSMIISLTLNIWLARYFGPEKYGAISYIFAFVGIFSFIANFGIGEILIRELVTCPEKKNKLLGTSSLLLAIGGFLAFLISSITGIITEPETLTKILIVFYSTIFIWSPINVISAYFQATVQAKKNAYVQIWGTVLVSIFKIFIILCGKGIIWIVFAFTLDYVIGGILYILSYIKSDLKIRDWEFDIKIAHTFFSSSFFLILSGATGYLLLKIDQVMLKFYLEKEAVGIYAAGVKLSEIWYVVPGIIASSIFPAIINAKKINTVFYVERLKKLYFFLILAAVGIAIPITFLAPYVVTILYGTEYVQSIAVLQIYIWSGIGLFLSVGINKQLITENHLKTIFLYSSCSAVLNIVLNMVLIPKIGINGSAVATLVSYSVGPVVILLLYKLNILKHDK